MENNILTKANIEEMAYEIMNFLIKHHADEDVAIFFNNKRMVTINCEDERKIVIGEGFNPLDYFEYANPKHILSMTFEGVLYEIINCRDMCYLSPIFEKYGVYAELGNAWNLSVFSMNGNMKIEYTDYSKSIKKEPIYLYNNNLDQYPALKSISDMWREFSKKVGDIGSCVLGAGFSFEYEGNLFFLPPHSCYQGSISWETDKDEIKQMLQLIGCGNIQYHWGNLD